ncbi:pterin-4-alpha-carbinolamine dehydratase [Hasllibacter halocynthiae]|uniref:Putative pterin-4-alpha-carbinolamine dehydratase n=1 Tax=Hasllibacter halocynthiae TaxID=595589 RepID=A0A2T0X1V9_9RHOB|nr:4a-hydroxytetrahydrobiopterin dehydratase [Hasllibacter halocynthiae]PRY92936.1 pterin-4-alpha-carbinolamine dehydratase [Hasllibacter halocynthiae]
MSRPRRLSPGEVEEALASLPEWRQADGALRRRYRFADFGEAWAFMTRCALLAEKVDHHPDWRNVWSRVDVALTTHDAGGVTQLDVEMARAMDALA